MTDFEKARDERSEEEVLRYDNSIGYCIECFNDGANWAREYFETEIIKLKAIIADKPNENDSLGAEYVHVCILKNENDELKAKADKLAEAAQAIDKAFGDNFICGYCESKAGDGHVSQCELKQALKEYRCEE